MQGPEHVMSPHDATRKGLPAGMSSPGKPDRMRAFLPDADGRYCISTWKRAAADFSSTASSPMRMRKTSDASYSPALVMSQ